MLAGDSINVLSDFSRSDEHFPGVLHYLTGLFSYESSPCAPDGRPIVYTNITAYSDWILHNMKP